MITFVFPTNIGKTKVSNRVGLWIWFWFLRLGINSLKDTCFYRNNDNKEVFLTFPTILRLKRWKWESRTKFSKLRVFHAHLSCPSLLASIERWFQRKKILRQSKCYVNISIESGGPNFNSSFDDEDYIQIIIETDNQFFNRLLATVIKMHGQDFWSLA